MSDSEAIMSDMDPGKMKVVELRAELSSRGLDTKGNKAALVDRLREALEKETGQGLPRTSIADTSTEDGAEDEGTGQDSEQNEGDSQDSLDIKPEIKKEAAETPVEIKQEPEESVKQEEKQQLQPTEGKHEPGIKHEHREHHEHRGEKRQRSRSPDRGWRNQPLKRQDNEPEYDESAVILSWYDSDMNLVIDTKNFTSAAPMFEQGFGFIWAGTRATYGFTSGKVFFEVKITEHCDVSHLEDEPSPHVVRVGFSADDTTMQLGEDPLSYGYGGTAKASTNCKFKDYGAPFQAGDCIGAFLDLNSNPIILSYTLNGQPQGVAYEISRTELKGKALFPHVLTKNSKFECNFGNEDPWFPPLSGYTFAGKILVDQRVMGSKRPENREDCEIIMMCGLPGCGKTTWANEWYQKNLEKKYNILGTNNLIDKMKVMGLPRKRNYAGRWDVLIDKCTKCLNKLLELASRRRRNYILDQTNVYPSAQRRKMRGFEGYIRRAVVIVPTDEEFNRRVAKREKEEGKDVPESAVLEMKANFKIPEIGDIFSEVIYTELPEPEARVLIEQYNKEGRDAGYGLPQNKRFKSDSRDSRDNRGPPPFRGGFGRGRGGSDRGRGGWQPRGGGVGGWRDRSSSYQSSGQTYHGNSQSGWRGGSRGRSDSYSSGRGSSGYGSGGGYGSNSSYGSSGGYDRNRSSGGGRTQSSGNKSWGTGGYNQGNSNWGSGGAATNSGNWGSGQGYNQSNYNSAGQNYNQQGWKGSGYNQQGGYGQQAYSGQQGYDSTAANTSGYNSGGTTGTGTNWNQQYYNQGQGSYGAAQTWNQGTGTTSGYGYGQSQPPLQQPQQPQQGAWQGGYGQSGYNYGQQGGYGK